MTMKKYYVQTADCVQEVMAAAMPTADELAKLIDGYIEMIVPAKGHHICKYCQSIADGSDKDVLCKDCRDLFGHYLYSEL